MFVCSLACKSVRRAGSGDKLGAVECICWLVCVLMGLLVWAGWGGGVEEPPCLHCGSDLWPFVTLSEWEGRQRQRVRGRDFK